MRSIGKRIAGVVIASGGLLALVATVTAGVKWG